MKDEELQIALIEKQVLHAIMDNPDFLFEDDIFISEQAKEFQYILLSLKDENKNFIAEHILCKTIEYVTREVVLAVEQTEYQKDQFYDYKSSLRKKYILHDFRVNSLRELSRTEDDIDKLIALHDIFEDSIEKIDDTKKGALTFSELVDGHKKIEEKRAHQIQVTSGCYKWDELIPNPVAGIITVCGFSGSTKSTLCHYLIKQRIAKRLYTTYFNTELALTGVMDSMIPSMIKTPYNDIIGLDNDDDRIDFDGILNKYTELSEHYKNRNNFLMFPESNVSLSDLKNFNIMARKKFGMKDDDLLYCFVDLLSMVKEFSDEGNSTRADMITQAINRLNEIALKYNILFICTVQLKRMPQKITIEKEEDIEKFRPDLTLIKDSGSYEERSRVVIGIHNPYHIVRKVNCNKIVKDLTEPIIELQCLKNTYTGRVGHIIKYYFNSDFKVYVPYEETKNEVSNTDDKLDNNSPYTSDKK